jgi:hypothetical protein
MMSQSFALRSLEAAITVTAVVLVAIIQVQMRCLTSRTRHVLAAIGSTTMGCERLSATRAAGQV